jgi:hypothetical protein
MESKRVKPSDAVVSYNDLLKRINAACGDTGVCTPYWKELHTNAIAAHAGVIAEDDINNAFYFIACSISLLLPDTPILQSVRDELLAIKGTSCGRLLAGASVCEGAPNCCAYMLADSMTALTVAPLIILLNIHTHAQKLTCEEHRFTRISTGISSSVFTLLCEALLVPPKITEHMFLSVSTLQFVGCSLGEMMRRVAKSSADHMIPCVASLIKHVRLVAVLTDDAAEFVRFLIQKKSDPATIYLIFGSIDIYRQYDLVRSLRYHRLVKDVFFATVVYNQDLLDFFTICEADIEMIIDFMTYTHSQNTRTGVLSAAMQYYDWILQDIRRISRLENTGRCEEVMRVLIFTCTESEHNRIKWPPVSG